MDAGIEGKCSRFHAWGTTALSTRQGPPYLFIRDEKKCWSGYTWGNHSYDSGKGKRNSILPLDYTKNSLCTAIELWCEEEGYWQEESWHGERYFPQHQSFSSGWTFELWFSWAKTSNITIDNYRHCLWVTCLGWIAGLSLASCVVFGKGSIQGFFHPLIQNGVMIPTSSLRLAEKKVCTPLSVSPDKILAIIIRSLCPSEESPRRKLTQPSWL